MNTLLKVALTFGLICLAAGESIVSLQLNKAEGQMYAISNLNYLYELDNVAVEQNNIHALNFSYPASSTSTYIKKINGQKTLFQAFSEDYTQIAKYNLPFGNRPVLFDSGITPEGYGSTSDTPVVFVDQKSIAIAITNQNKLNLFDLVTMNKTDDIFIYRGHKQGATAVLYNHKTNSVVVFKYLFIASPRSYRMTVLEYNVINNLFVEKESTYPQDSADFSNSKANFAAFDASNNKYWILDDQSVRLIKFSSNNMAVYSFIPLGSINWDIGYLPLVAYNFGAQLAYVVSDSEIGFYLQEVDLSSGVIRRAAAFDTTNQTAATVQLDIEEGNLYIGLVVVEATAPARLSVVDLGNFQQEIITLTH